MGLGCRLPCHFSHDAASVPDCLCFSSVIFAVMLFSLQQWVMKAATLCARGCNPMPSSLQHGDEAATYVVEAANLRGGGCSPTWWRLQPFVVEAATLCGARLKVTR